MLKSLLLAVTLCLATQVRASLNESLAIDLTPSTPEDRAVETLRDLFDGFTNISQTTTFTYSYRGHSKFLNTASNGDFVILWGIGSSAANQTMTETEYKNMWRLMNYLASKDFRVVMNVRSTGEDLKEAAKSNTTSVILFSAHGSTESFFDYNGAAVPYDVFTEKAPNVYQFILSACYGRVALDKNYVIPKDLYTLSWSGLTNSTEMIEYLVSEKWTGYEGKTKP